MCYYNQRILDSSRFKFRETSERIKELAKVIVSPNIKILQESLNSTVLPKIKFRVKWKNTSKVVKLIQLTQNILVVFKHQFGKLLNLRNRNRSHFLLFMTSLVTSSDLMWPIKKYKCGDRLLCLAKPKSYDDIYIPDRNVCNIIAPAVLSASCTSRIQALAKPKRSFSADHHYIDSRQPEDPITNVSRQARMHQSRISNFEPPINFLIVIFQKS